MLDAFGKGASEDIRLAKEELYKQMTWDAATSSSTYTEPSMTTPLPSPPVSPKPEGLHFRSESGDGAPKQSPLISPFLPVTKNLLWCSRPVA